MHPELVLYLATGELIQLTRDRPGDPTIPAFLLDLSNELALIHQFRDFSPDGYAVVRTADVTEVRRSSHEVNFERMYRAEGLLGALSGPPTIDLTSMRTAIASVARLYPHMIIECEDDEEDAQDFYLGVLSEVSDEVARFDHVDDLGVWADPPATIWLNEVTRLQFDTPYANIFWRHLQTYPDR